MYFVRSLRSTVFSVSVVLLKIIRRVELIAFRMPDGRCSVLSMVPEIRLTKDQLIKFFHLS